MACYWSYLVVMKSMDTENTVNRYAGGGGDPGAGFVGRPG